MKGQLVCHFAHIGSPVELSWLLEHGCDPDSKDTDGVSALSHASEQGHVESATLLLKHGAFANTQDKGATPLILACMEGHVDIVSTLLAIQAKTE